jgi:V8-like Glu-specific endopeptidase
MHALFEKMLKTTLSNLRQLEKRGVLTYKVIIDDEEHGSLEVVARKIKRSSRLGLPFGTLRDHVVPYVNGMEPGDLVEIPYGDYPPENVRSNACAWATTAWGRGTYTSTVNRKTKNVELYRYPADEVKERTS